MIGLLFFIPLEVTLWILFIITKINKSDRFLLINSCYLDKTNKFDASNYDFFFLNGKQD